MRRISKSTFRSLRVGGEIYRSRAATNSTHRQSVRAGGRLEHAVNFRDAHARPVTPTVPNGFPRN
jgi:hypothetical protein